jgi:hypothetical protein
MRVGIDRLASGENGLVEIPVERGVRIELEAVADQQQGGAPVVLRVARADILGVAASLRGAEILDLQQRTEASSKYLGLSASMTVAGVTATLMHLADEYGPCAGRQATG